MATKLEQPRARGIRQEPGEQWTVGTVESEDATPPVQQPQGASSGRRPDELPILRARCRCCGFVVRADFWADGLCYNCRDGIHLPADWGSCKPFYDQQPQDDDSLPWEPEPIIQDMLL